MKKIKYVIFSIIVIILFLILIILKINNNSKPNDEEYLNNEGKSELIEMQNTIQISDYFIVKNCIQNYLDILNKNNSIYYDMQEDGNQKYNEKIHKEIIYTLLNEDYIEYNKINIQNVFDYVENIESKQRFYPIEIIPLTEGEINTFKVYGIMQNLDYKNAKRVYYTLKYDYANNTFCIQPLNSKSYENYEEKNELKKIDKKDYNKCNLDQISTENIAVEYFELYKFLTLANPEITYNMMTEEYRNKRFGTLDNYKQYIQDNYEEFIGIYAKKYLTNNTNKAVQYVIKDQYENLYIFDVKSTMDYTIKLDTYTLDEEKFLKTYNSSNESQRVQMNIGKFFDMINRYDYRTSYNCLDDTFKNNNYKSEQVFKNFIKNNLFEYNNFTVKELKSVGSNTYACRLSITNKTTEDEGGLGMTVIMQLLEGTNFVMSFSMN